jgi:4-amino-4-deoxy-L-arabinose transferase-like glycosyltransferase
MDRVKWTNRDYVSCGLIITAAAFLFLVGLSTRSLWGSEGRWAVAAREMLQSGNIFLPTINGDAYFDKPLLGYWAILPFYAFFDAVEWAARLPASLAGIGCVFVTFVFGRRLYGGRVGVLSGILLLTSPMFALWSRTISADVENVLAVWVMLWVYLSWRRKGELPQLFVFYGIGAIASFVKGPVAPALVFFTVTLHSIVEAALGLRESRPFTFANATSGLSREFRWLLSRGATLAVLPGLAIFTVLLLLPVWVTGAWGSVSAMWRENIVRFFKPFDHTEPVYVYVYESLVFILPWSFVFMASLWGLLRRAANPSIRFVLIVGAAIFLFFAISGSRRGYYILPLLPTLAIIGGKGLSDWLDATRGKMTGLVKVSVTTTALLLLLIGLVMLLFYAGVTGQSELRDLQTLRHPSELFLGAMAIAAAFVVLHALKRRHYLRQSLCSLVQCLSLRRGVSPFSWGWPNREGASNLSQPNLRRCCKMMRKYPLPSTESTVRPSYSISVGRNA